MRSLLRAEWLRQRRRLDVWGLLAGVVVLTLLGYFSGLANRIQYSGPPGDPVPPEVLAQDLLLRNQYTFPASIATLLGMTGVGSFLLYLAGLSTVPSSPAHRGVPPTHPADLSVAPDLLAQPASGASPKSHCSGALLRRRSSESTRTPWACERGGPALSCWTMASMSRLSRRQGGPSPTRVNVIPLRTGPLD